MTRSKVRSIRTWFVTPIAATLLFVAASCSSDSPTAPSAQTPSPTIASVTLVPGTDWLTLGSSVSLTAFVTMSTGTGQAMDAVWKSSNPQIAEVSDRGVVRGVAAGRASVTATAGGVTATRALRVAPDFTSTWSGRVVVNSCVEVVGVSCAVQAGQGANVGAVLAQIAERVSGIVQIRGLAVPVSGTIAEDGALTLEGVLEDRSGTRVDNRHTWRGLRLTTDGAGSHVAGRGTLESEYFSVDGSLRARSVVDYSVSADRATALPTPN